MATEHPISVVASEFFYIVVFLHGITLGYPNQKLLTFLIYRYDKDKHFL